MECGNGDDDRDQLSHSCDRGKRNGAKVLDSVVDEAYKGDNTYREDSPSFMRSGYWAGSSQLPIAEERARRKISTPREPSARIKLTTSLNCEDRTTPRKEMTSPNKLLQIDM